MRRQKAILPSMENNPKHVARQQVGAGRADWIHLLLPADPGEDFLDGVEWITLANALRLTTRETMVCALLLQGRTRKAIAIRLKLSPETVRVHIDRLFEKFHVQDRLGLALRIARIREVFRYELES